MTENGPMFPTDSVNLQMTTTARTEIGLLCLLCTEIDENLISVLHCIELNKAILFDHSNAYIVSQARVHYLRRHILPIASVQDNAYIIKVHNVNSVSRAKILHGSAMTTQRQTMPKRIIIKLKNPTTQKKHNVVVNVPLIVSVTNRAHY